MLHILLTFRYYIVFDLTTCNEGRLISMSVGREKPETNWKCVPQ